MNYVRSNSLSLKYQGFPPSDIQDIGIRKFEFVAKNSIPLASSIDHLKVPILEIEIKRYR